MLVYRDKRADERIVSDASIIFSPFSTRLWREYPSRTRNHSKDGMCLESNHFMAPGAYVFIRAGKHSGSGMCGNRGAGLRTSTLAEVKWCHTSGESESAYCVGVKYI